MQINEVKIEQKKPLAGSVEWLKNQISKSKFYFSETKKDNKPCICWALPDDEPGKYKKAEIVALLEPDEDAISYYGYQKYRDNCAIALPASENSQEEAAMFHYLTHAAYAECNKLIKRLADELIKKASSDKGELKITVTVE